MPQLELFEPPQEAPALQESLLQHEYAEWKRGYKLIAGVDEAGRGPLAGPVVACACILPKGVHFHGIKDSKVLSPKERKRLSDFLTTHPGVYWATGVISHETIDQINILRATLLAMKQAVETLSLPPDYVLVDGRDYPPIPHAGRPLVRGDSLSQSIGAASIIAKVFRDDLMDDYHKQYPHYGFDKHKGYGTLQHRKAIEKYGLCPIHRKSFSVAKVEAATLF